VKKTLRFVASLLLTAGLLWLLFRKVDLSAVSERLAESAPGPVAGAVALSFLTNCCLASWRWAYILDRLGADIGFGEAFAVKMGSSPIKSLLPFRSGEASRVLYLKRRHGFSALRGTASVALELGSNLAVFGMMVVAGGIVFGAGLDGAVLFLGCALFLGAAGLALLSRPRARRQVRERVEKMRPGRCRDLIRAVLSIPGALGPGPMLRIFLFSLAIQAGKLLGFFLAGKALGIRFPAPVFLVALPFSILISTIPITVLGIGLRENSLAGLVPLFCAVPEAGIVGTALLFSLAEYVFPALLGFGWTRSFLDGLIRRSPSRTSPPAT